MPATFLYVLVCDDCLLKFDWTTGYSRFMIYNVANFLIILKTLINPIIYAARMHEIQVATRRMQSSLCGLFGFGKMLEERNSLALHSSEGLPVRVGYSSSNRCPKQPSSKWTHAGLRCNRDNTPIWAYAKCDSGPVRLVDYQFIEQRLIEKQKID